MKVFHSSKKFPRSLKNPIVALGNFDGVHLAHQKMFKMALQKARKVHGTAVAYTFHPHPVQVLSKESAPPMINTLSQKLELIEKLGMHAVVVEPFDINFAHLPAAQWFRKILLENLHAFGVIAGYDFTFGTHRSGTIETLEELCSQHKISCQVLEAQLLHETLISSTQIRAFVMHGSMERARELLGRSFYIDGKVIKGVGRGASLGIRTANLKVENELIPLSGVYACYAQLGSKKYKAVTNIGMNPTFGGKTLSIEVHLLHFSREIYGKQLRLHFVKRIREEQSFATAEELVKQIHADIKAAQKVL